LRFWGRKYAKNSYFMPKIRLKLPKIKLFSPKIFLGNPYEIFGGIFGDIQPEQQCSIYDLRYLFGQ
jgi:hypothetical protein